MNLPKTRAQTNRSIAYLIPVIPTLASIVLGFAPPTQAAHPDIHLAQSDVLSASANTFFRPPNNPRPRSGSSTTTGSRTDICLGTQHALFSILGPEKILGLTSKSHPTFAWYLPPTENTPPVEFRLLRLNDGGVPERVHTKEIAYTPGYNSYQLPAEIPALASGKEYRWQIVIDCDPRNPSKAIAQELSFERVSASSEVIQKLTLATTAADEAIAYGGAGLWYDAIASVIQANNPEDISARTGLLRDLANTAKMSPDGRESLLGIAELGNVELSRTQ